MKSRLVSVCCVLLLAGCALPPRDAAPPAVGSKVSNEPSSPPAVVASESAGHVALWYIPNRISDLLDIVRARLRLGPGLEVGARFTDAAIWNAGGYSSVFIGIPGPRRERVFNWPAGVETMRGGTWSPFDGTAWSGDGPHYGRLEIGLGTQLLIVGADLGVDIYEALDFITGLVTVDLSEDDI
jgi:hypothetical protein